MSILATAFIGPRPQSLWHSIRRVGAAIASGRCGDRDASLSADTIGRMEAEALEEFDDATLFQAHRDGSADALRVLIQRYRVELFGFLARYTGNPTLAEDAFQETFLQVHLAGHTFDATRRFRPWLYAIAVNKARDLHRRGKRHRMASLDAPIGVDGDTTAVTLIGGKGPPVSEGLDRAELADAVRRAVDSLPETHREILVLGYFQKMSYQQIAEILEIPLGTVKSRLHAAVARFAKRWETLSSTAPNYKNMDTRS